MSIAPLSTIGELLEQLGDVPARRVRLKPTPGTATERDVIGVEARENRLCELVDGVLSAARTDRAARPRSGRRGLKPAR